MFFHPNRSCIIRIFSVSIDTIHLLASSNQKLYQIEYLYGKINSKCTQFAFSHKMISFCKVIYLRKKKKSRRQRRNVSEALYKSYTILTRGLSSVALAMEEGRKLHPSSSAPQITP